MNFTDHKWEIIGNKVASYVYKIDKGIIVCDVNNG